MDGRGSRSIIDSRPNRASEVTKHHPRWASKGCRKPRERWKWIDTDQCWRVGTKGRQNRKHLSRSSYILYAVCVREIRTLWKRVGEASGHRSEGVTEDIFWKSRKGFGYHVRPARARYSSNSVRDLLAGEPRRYWTERRWAWLGPEWSMAYDRLSFSPLPFPLPASGAGTTRA